MNEHDQRAQDVISITAADLRHVAAGILAAAGMPRDDAALSAHILVAANLRGVDTHGVLLLPMYVRRLRRRWINPTPRRSFEQRRSAVGILDADYGMGNVATAEAMEQAIRMAKESGVATVLVKNSNHFGAAAYYAMAAARQNCVGMVWSPAESSVVPYGGRQPFFGTNPIAISAPAGHTYPGFTLDMATSVVAGGKISAAARNHQTIPAGWIVDREGKPVTQPSDDIAILRTYLNLPLAGAKGYGLATVTEWTTSLLLGTQWGPTIPRWSDDSPDRVAIGHYVQALDVTAFDDLARYRQRVDDFCAALKAIAPADGFDEVMAPGEPELRTEQRRSVTGCPLTPHAFKVLRDLAADAGLQFPPHGAV